MSDLTDEQVSTEREMHALGVDRTRSKWAKARERGLVSTTRPGRHLLREAIGPFAQELGVWLARAQSRSGPQHSAAEYLDLLPASVLAILTTKVLIDRFHEERTYSVLSHSVGKRVEDEVRARILRDKDARLWDRLQRILNRAGEKFVHPAVREICKEAEIPPWPLKGRLAAGMVCVDILIRTTGLFEFHDVKRRGGRGGKTFRRQKYVIPTEGLVRWVEEAVLRTEGAAPYWYPTVIPPRPWGSVDSGGYYLPESWRPAVKVWSRELLDEIRLRGLGEALPAINALQESAWEVNRFVWEAAGHFWRSRIRVADFPDRDEVEIPRKPGDIETNEEARRAWRREAAKAYSERATQRSRRLLYGTLVDVAERFGGRPIWFPYQADFRGRVYPVPYFLQPQGPRLAKGLLRFNRAREVTAGSPGHRWLLVHAANCWGVRGPFEGRVSWVEEHRREIEDVAKDPVDCRWWESAGEPWQFLAACDELSSLWSEGRVQSRIPVTVDGSNNGLQLYSLLVRDPVGAEATNIAPGGTPRDIYQTVADQVTAGLRADGGETARVWLEFCGGALPREAVKRAVMTLPYGVTKFRANEYVRDWFVSCLAEGRANPFRGNYYRPSLALSDRVWGAIRATVGRATECMSWLRECADVLSGHGVPVRWTSPSGFLVVQDYRKQVKLRTMVLVYKTYRSVTFGYSKDAVDPVRQRNGIAPNFIHSIDAACLALAVLRLRDLGIRDVMAVHDSFGVHADRVDTLRGALLGVYADVFSRDLLTGLRGELQSLLPPGGALPDPPALGEFDVREVLKSSYAFH